MSKSICGKHDRAYETTEVCLYCVAPEIKGAVAVLAQSTPVAAVTDGFFPVTATYAHWICTDRLGANLCGSKAVAMCHCGSARCTSHKTQHKDWCAVRAKP